MTPGRTLALDLDGVDVQPLAIVPAEGAASLESLLGANAMTEVAASCSPTCSCCVACCCCCCG
ncbi:hypothetical protein HNP84_003363 [Thermocatellispora tengchongensis]|uniref:Uncharacterized protein n=1 Tax=Thermocatellispora tengchongensis TaxID=1073253 RepID=A0A840P8V1_9ACTN|nr:hypothetical protein [Thermocatellispora tengchongensis]MBB5133637.1 hypothetical protein [Thermocatellispora tengchongensis]